MRESNREWNNLTEPLMKSFLRAEWLVLPEFGLITPSGVKRVDLAAFNWDGEYEALGFECKYESDSRKSLFSALGQAIEYQQYFKDVYIVTQNGEFYSDEENILTSLGIGLIRVDIDENQEILLVKSSYDNNTFFDTDFSEYVRNQGIILIVFNTLFPDSYKKGHYGGSRQADLWIFNKPIGKVQYRAYAGLDRDVKFGINIESVKSIRNIYKNLDIDVFHKALSNLTYDFKLELWERATIINKNEKKMLDRSKGSISIEGSIFEQEGYPACEITKKQIRNQIIKNISKYDHYVHMLIDNKIWDVKDELSKEEYIDRMNSARKSLTELYDLFTNWSRG